MWPAGGTCSSSYTHVTCAADGGAGHGTRAPWKHLLCERSVTTVGTYAGGGCLGKGSHSLHVRRISPLKYSAPSNMSTASGVCSHKRCKACKLAKVLRVMDPSQSVPPRTLAPVGVVQLLVPLGFPQPARRTTRGQEDPQEFLVKLTAAVASDCDANGHLQPLMWGGAHKRITTCGKCG
jgi:hypothetical protein